MQLKPVPGHAQLCDSMQDPSQQPPSYYKPHPFGSDGATSALDPTLFIHMTLFPHHIIISACQGPVSKVKLEESMFLIPFLCVSSFCPMD